MVRQHLIFPLLLVAAVFRQSCGPDKNANAVRNANRSANVPAANSSDEGRATQQDKAAQNPNANQNAGARGRQQQQSPPIWDREGIPPAGQGQNINGKNSNGDAGKKSGTNRAP